MTFEDRIAALPDAERNALMEHIKGGTPSRAIARVLKRNGIPCGKSTINVYRKRIGL